MKPDLYLFNYAVSMQEVPNEISLTIGLYDCPFHCEGCHSPSAQKSGAEEGAPLLDKDYFVNLLRANHKVSVVTFFGGDTNPEALIELLSEARSRDYKTCLYTGATKVSSRLLEHLDFVKVGPYQEAAGPLTSNTTNQRMYMRTRRTGKKLEEAFLDITHKFWR